MMMLKKIYALLALALLAAPLEAGAGQAGPGHVVDVISFNSGVLLFNLTATQTGAPSCSTNPGRWAINAATPAGQSMLSVVLNAKAANKQLIVVGTGDCAVWADTESAIYVRMP